MSDNDDNEIMEAPPYCDNRELSWLKFNARVLEEARDPRNPFCERLNFASIFQSNLDEFFMVRVGMLYDNIDSDARDNKTNMTFKEQLDAVMAQVDILEAEHDRVCTELFKELKDYGIEIAGISSLDDETTVYLENYFIQNVMPLLSPQIVSRKQPFPFLQSKEIYVVVMFKNNSGNSSNKMGIVHCGNNVLRRLVKLPGDEARYILMEDLILHFVPLLFDRYYVDSRALIRIVRSADMDMEEAIQDPDYRESMEKLLNRRKRLYPVRMEYCGTLDDEALTPLCRYLDLPKTHVIRVSSSLDLGFIDTIRDELRDRKELFYPHRFPQQSVNVDLKESIIEQIRRKDILLSYPYESIRPFLQLLNEAGQDPEVESIKMTLYRMARNSKVVEALVDAAQNGKEVVVLVELRARFDEENNIDWSRVLEEGGCRVIYGLDGLKVHSKLMLITSYHNDQVEYITQVGTGNYNENTVKLYADYSLMTASRKLGAEAADIFTHLCMGETVEDTRYFMVAPLCLKNRVLTLIDREIEQARKGNPAYIGLKMNSFTDREIIDKMVEASQAGVKIDLVVRGICCIIGGVPGYTDNIRVTSIVGRYLEHARIYIFGSPERRRIYIGSADFMTRNTTYRVEVAVPIYDQGIKAQLEKMFFTQTRDNVKSRIQQPDGTYTYLTNDEEPLNSQEYFYDQAYNGEWLIPETKKEKNQGRAASSQKKQAAQKPQTERKTAGQAEKKPRKKVPETAFGNAVRSFLGGRKK